MTVHESLTPQQADPQLDRIIKLAVLAVGGQGGGVLTGWIEALARGNDRRLFCAVWPWRATALGSVVQSVAGGGTR